MYDEEELNLLEELDEEFGDGFEDDEFEDDDYEDDFEDDDLEDDDLEDAEFGDDVDDLTERRRRRRRGRRRGRRRVRTARARGLFQRRLNKSYVTQKQLKASLGRVSKSIRRNGGAIGRVNRRVSASNRRISGAISVNRRQSKAIKKNRTAIDQSRQMFLLTSLLSGGKKEVELTKNNGKTFLETKGDKLDSLLPLLLMGGLGGGKGGMDTMMLLLLAGAFDK